MNQDPKPQLGQAGLKAVMVYWDEKERAALKQASKCGLIKDMLIWQGLTLEAKEAISYGYS